MASDKRNTPNIIFCLADDLGYGDLGCYGQEVIQTPHIDRMAQEGVRFTDHYAGSTVCAPSRCTFMTGRDTGHSFVRGNGGIPLPPDAVTVAKLLKEAGYATGIFGKWGLGRADSTGIPTRQGFDDWFGYLHQGRAHNYYPEYLWQNEEKVYLHGNEDEGRRQYSDHLFTERALKWVREHHDEPFFLYWPVTLPHANNELGRETGDGMEIPDYGLYAGRDWPDPQKGHAAMISLLDENCGMMLDLLEKLGIDDNTLFIFTSDNGPHAEGGADPDFFESRGPLRGMKRDLYEGGIRVPMIARWPAQIEPGTVSDHPSAFWDYMPTFCDIAGCDTPPGIEGISMLPALKGNANRNRSHDILYWEFNHREFKQAVRMGDWKAVRNGLTRDIELYRLDEDIHEETNLAAEYPERIAEAAGIFENWRTESAEFPVSDNPG
ncbi:MAG: arylsulfatase [Armatimonadota bacterium]